MGISEEEDAIWAKLMNSVLGAMDPDLNPGGVEGAVEKDVPEIFERCQKLIAERRERPTDDLTSVLVNAEVDGSKLEEHEIVMGFFLLMAAGNDSTKATYCSGMRALMENPDQMQLLLDDPQLIPGAVEESLRMFPAFAHFRRTAMSDTELHGQKIKAGDKVVMWYVSSNRDGTRYEDPDRFDVRRDAEHQAFGAGGRHFCLGTALARLELEDPDGGDPAALSPDGHRRRPRVRRKSLHQPAQDAAGRAERLRFPARPDPGRVGLLTARAVPRRSSRPASRRSAAARTRPGRRSGSPISLVSAMPSWITFASVAFELKWARAEEQQVAALHVCRGGCAGRSWGFPRPVRRRSGRGSSCPSGSPLTLYTRQAKPEQS